MDSSNQAMWREAGIKVGQSMDRTYIAHPCFDGAYVFFCPDTPHLLKAIKTALCNHDFIIPDDIVRKNNLPGDTVSTFTDGMLLRSQNNIKQIDDFDMQHHS